MFSLTQNKNRKGIHGSLFLTVLCTHTFHQTFKKKQKKIQKPSKKHDVCCLYGTSNSKNSSTNTSQTTNTYLRCHTLVDPTSKEEALADGITSISMTQFGHFCAMEKVGGVPLTSREIMSLSKHCVKRVVKKWHKILFKELSLASLDDARKRRDRLHARIVNPIDVFQPLVFKDGITLFFCLSLSLSLSLSLYFWQLTPLSLSLSLSLSQKKKWPIIFFLCFYPSRWTSSSLDKNVLGIGRAC